MEFKSNDNTNSRELEYQLSQYQKMTLSLINYMEKEDYDVLELNFDKRQAIIDIIKTLDYSKECFQSISEKLQLMELEKKLRDLMNEKKQSLKLKMNVMQEGKSANKNYTRGMAVDSIFFNRKV